MWPSDPCLDFVVVWDEASGSAVGLDDHCWSLPTELFYSSADRIGELEEDWAVGPSWYLCWRVGAGGVGEIFFARCLLSVCLTP